MSHINLVILAGYLGGDAEIRMTQGGTAKVYFKMATTLRFKSRKTGNWEDKTSWHSVIMWGDHAVKLHPDLTKGSLVTVKGELETRSYDKEGEKRYVTEVRATDIVVHSKRREETKVAKEDPNGPDGVSVPDDDGDLPF